MGKKISYLIAILIIVITAVFIKNKFFGSLSKSKVYTDDLQMSDEAYLESLKDEPSEIAGMSKYDKLAMGLSIDVDDTDHDGLTDSDEIYLYHSDPTKKSTAGDFYTDKYKVDNDLDINTKYDYDGDLKFKWNSCDEVTLNATKIEDLDAVVEDSSAGIDKDSELGALTYKRYRVYNYSGDITIDLNNILTENNTTADNIAIYTQNLGGSVKKDKTKIDKNNVATLSSKFNSNDMSYVYIIDESESSKTKVVDLIKNINAMVQDESPAKNVKCLAVVKPIVSAVCLNFFGDKSGVKIYYTDNSDTYSRNAGVELVIEAVNSMIGGPFNDEDNKYTIYDYDSVQMVSEDEYNRLVNKYKLLDDASFLSDHLFDGDVVGQNFSQYFTWCYFQYEDIAGKWEVVDGEYSEKKPAAPKDTFDIATDTLPFANFATELSPNGSCLGISVITAELFNNKQLRRSGGGYLTSLNREVQWDLTGEDNHTFSDRGLSDYKDENFIKDRKSSSGIVMPQNDAEKQFLTMVGYYWAEGNSLLGENCQYSYRGKTNDDIKKIDDLITMLDAGYVAICALHDGQSGHAVVVYDYEYEDEDDPSSTIIFKVYDCNYANTEGEGARLYVYPVKMGYGHQNSFEYSLVTDKYTISSIGQDKYFITFFDERFVLTSGGQMVHYSK